jgi:hypothetical protein
MAVPSPTSQDMRSDIMYLFVVYIHILHTEPQARQTQITKDTLPSCSHKFHQAWSNMMEIECNNCDSSKVVSVIQCSCPKVEAAWCFSGEENILHEMFVIPCCALEGL